MYSTVLVSLECRREMRRRRSWKEERRKLEGTLGRLIVGFRHGSIEYGTFLYTVLYRAFMMNEPAGLLLFHIHKYCKTAKPC